MTDRVAALPGEPSDQLRAMAAPGSLVGRIVLQRTMQALVVAALVGTLGFLMMRLLPGDIAYRIAAGRYGYDMVTTAAAEAVRAELGLDQPWTHALLQWWSQLMRLDLGVSVVTGARVADEIAHQLGHTLQLALAALAVSCAIAVPLGFAAGLRAGGLADRATLVASALLRALPPFVLGIVLVSVLAIEWNLVPAGGHDTHGTLLLPALTLGLGLSATAMRVARHAMASVTAAPYFQFARTKGLGDAQALYRHGVRNAAIPLVAYLGVQLVYLVEGVVVIETLFAWPGIGHALVHAIFGRDIPMIQGTAIVMGLLFVALNALVDLACAWIDPRVRVARGASW
ncbi:ABC transporter permease [Cupriavidus sp. H18C2]|uniref:ABC transporter permease n=1 Tax=Cupriavidus sp. H18C2 TaxID=3241602 RepID=UPI003BF7CB7F